MFDAIHMATKILWPIFSYAPTGPPDFGLRLWKAKGKEAKGVVEIIALEDLRHMP